MDFFSSNDLTKDKKMDFFFCDTTLRDGEQVAGVHYSPEQKLKIAKKLADIGIESIDAGFAATSPEERHAIKMICEQDLNMRIMSMCRVIKSDIDHALECGVNGVILFIPGSDIHLKAKFSGSLESTRKELISKSVDAIKYAKDKGLFVEFGVEDSTRTDMSVLIDTLSIADESGADVLGTTDTIGCFTPEKTYAFIKEICQTIKKPVGVHCHNDLGLATANTIAGLLAGGGYCSPTVNGMGERAGNASLEEVLMILKALYNQDLPYTMHSIGEVSALVEEYSKIAMDIFKPVVGKNAYSHESGIHTHGMIKDTNTYEVFDPALIGRARKYAMGKHAGKHVVQYVLSEYGFDVTDELVAEFWKHMKANEKPGTFYTEKDVIDQFKEYHCAVV